MSQDTSKPIGDSPPAPCEPPPAATGGKVGAVNQGGRKRQWAWRRWLARIRLEDDSYLGQHVVQLIAARIGPNISTFIEQRQLLVWFLALGIGVGVSYAAIGFRLAIGAIGWLWLGTMTEKIASAAAATPWWTILLAPMFGGLIVGYVLEHHMPGKRALSIADVIEARAVKDCNISLVAGLWSAVLAVISLGFGASVGREGPIVHLGAAIASTIEDRFQLSRSTRRTLLACGVAAAISASFNAPIAGVLFAHEVILAHYAFSAFVPIVIASVIATIISRIHLGDFPAFIIPNYQFTTYLEFPAFALLGVTCAVVAIAFETALMATERVAWRIDVPLWIRPAVGGLIVGAIAVFFPQILGVGYEATDNALHNAFPLWMLLALIVAKTAATSICLASRFAGGIFSPALYLGAMAGGAFGIIASSVFPELSSSQGLYAILGMGAVSAAVLGAPLSTTLIVFELTRGYEITVALLLTVSIAHGLTQAALGFSFFHWQLSKRGLSLMEGPHKEIMRQLLVNDFMHELEDRERPDDIDEHGEAPWLTPSDTLEKALRTFDESGETRVAVVAPDRPGHVVGWADRLTAVRAYNNALIDRHVEEHR